MSEQSFVTLNQISYWELIKDIGSFNDRWDDSVVIKAEIFLKLIKSLQPNAETVLFLHFNPIIFYISKFYKVTVICNSDILNSYQHENITSFETIDSVSGTFDITLGIDEHLTYFDSELRQRQQIDRVAKLTKGWFITTLQDYKNFAPHKKNQIEAVSVNGNHNYIMLESSIVDKFDKQLWYHYWLCIVDHSCLKCFGPRARRTMYFKQLAKYSVDAGSTQYVIQKNLLYKGFFSKNFEHIITVKFG